MARAIETAELAVRKASSPMRYQWARSTLAWVYCRTGEPKKGYHEHSHRNALYGPDVSVTN